MATVTLSDGRTLSLRPMYISDKAKIVAVQERDEEAQQLDILTEMASLIEPAVTAKSWEGSLLDMTEMQLLHLAREWARLTDEDALPPGPGAGSETT